MYIKFPDIPGHNDLFLDYLYNFENVRKFYKKDFRNTEYFKVIFEQLANTNRPHKNSLIEIIKKQYVPYEPSKQTEYNIELLKSEKTLAVVTGQQLGIFGGPLYTFYKIITAIKLCKHLKEQHDEYQFVPIFWMEGDDHDLDEIRSMKVIADNNEIITLTYDDGLPPEENRGSVGNLIFNDNLNHTLDELKNTLRDTEYKQELLELIGKYYKEGVTIKKAFRDLLFDVFDENGLIIFDPTDYEVKKLLSPIFKKEIEDFRDHTSSVVERSAELEESFHTQVKVKPINLFMLEETERLLIEPVEEEYRLKGKRKKITKEEMLNIVETEPERFSPNVLLRPVCQDYLLPTAMYVGGPGEISYFAQVSPLYEFFDIMQPIVYPRSSVTIVEKNIQDILKKYSLSYEDVFAEAGNLENKVITALSEINLESVFEKYLDAITPPIKDVKDNLTKIDKTLEDTVDKTMQRIEQAVNQLKGKAEGAEKRRFEAAIRQLQKTKSALFPEDNLQEREINFIHFANKYGLDILKWIFSELTINKFEHQILEL